MGSGRKRTRNERGERPTLNITDKAGKPVAASVSSNPAPKATAPKPAPKATAPKPAPKATGYDANKSIMSNANAVLARELRSARSKMGYYKSQGYNPNSSVMKNMENAIKRMAAGQQPTAKQRDALAKKYAKGAGGMPIDASTVKAAQKAINRANKLAVQNQRKPVTLDGYKMVQPDVRVRKMDVSKMEQADVNKLIKRTERSNATAEKRVERNIAQARKNMTANIDTGSKKGEYLRNKIKSLSKADMQRLYKETDFFEQFFMYADDDGDGSYEDRLIEQIAKIQGKSEQWIENKLDELNDD